MTIAFLHDCYPGIGGTEKVTDMLSSFFKSKGLKCIIISHRYTTYSQKSKVFEDNEIFYLDAEKSLNSNENNVKIINIANNQHIDFLINQGPFWQGNTEWNHDKCKVISVLHYSPTFKIDNIRANIDYQFHRRQYSLRDRIVSIIRYLCKPYFTKKEFVSNEKLPMANTIQNSDAMVVLSEGYVDKLRKLYDVKNTSFIYSIPNAISNVSDCQSNCEKEKRLLFVGRLTHWDKRVDRLLRIWKNLQSEFEDWSLDIVGDGPEKAKLEELSKKLCLDRVCFHGFKNPQDFYKRSPVICMTSSSEGFPMVILEASQYECCTIAYDVSDGMRQLVNDKISGLLIIPFNQKLYEAELSKLMSDYNYRKTLGINAKEECKKYNLEMIGNLWLSLFKKL